MKLPTLSLNNILESSNIAEFLDADTLSDIGIRVIEEFEIDLISREDWERRNAEAMKLALQIKEAKNFPWPNAANVKFPLITIAALQYHARSYPVLLGSDLPVKCRVMGQDPDGRKTERAQRVENHMSWQILEEDEAWEEETDKLMITQPIMGCAFKKSYFDSLLGHNVSEFVLPKDLVVNYWAKNIDTAPRISHILYMSSNDIYEREADGIWLSMTDSMPADNKVEGPLKELQEKRQGISDPPATDESAPFEIIEQHRFFDFDGDGYEEPYIVIVRRDTKQVLRIVARFFSSGVKKNSLGKILKITPEKYFTKYPFIPSPDGGFYDLGFGVLLGPLNESINTILNQLLDAGTMANTAGGFLSRGVKIRGGSYSFAPLEWKHVDSTGDDLTKGIVPLPVREPSNVLFQLLDLLINYGERIGISVDILAGENPGQNTPAETSRTMAEQGMKIFSGIFKRTRRALGHEFRLLYRLNQLYLQKDTQFRDNPDNTGMVMKTDYDGDGSIIAPSADPNVVSDSQRIAQAAAIKQVAAGTPGYDPYEVEKMYLKALRVPNIDQLYPDPKGPNAVPPPVDPKVQIEQMKMQERMQTMQAKMRLEALKLMQNASLIAAQVQQLEAQAINLLAQAKGVDVGHDIELINAQIAAAKEKREGMVSQADTLLKIAADQRAAQQETAPQPEKGAMQMQTQGA